MKIVNYSSVPSQEWNKVCQESDEAWLFHNQEWIEIESRFFAQKNLSFGIQNDNGELIGTHPLYLRKCGLGSWVEKILDSGIHRHAGLALNYSSGVNIKVARKLSMFHVFKLAEQFDVDRIHLNSHNLAPRNMSPKREEIPFWVTDYGFHLGLHFSQNGFIPVPGMATCCADQIILLEGLDERGLFRNLDEKSCQWAVKKAIKNNLEISFGESGSGVDEYYELAKVSAERTKEPLPPLEYYTSLTDALSRNKKCLIMFASHERKKIGALILLRDKESVNYMAGVSHPEYLKYCVNDFIQWSAIKWARETGYSYYRLGPIFPEIPKTWPLARVSRFKKKFGGRSVPTIQGSFFRKPEKYLERGREEIEKMLQDLKPGVWAAGHESEESDS